MKLTQDSVTLTRDEFRELMDLLKQVPEKPKVYENACPKCGTRGQVNGAAALPVRWTVETTHPATYKREGLCDCGHVYQPGGAVLLESVVV